jgi:hypothetical protein
VWRRVEKMGGVKWKRKRKKKKKRKRWRNK